MAIDYKIFNGDCLEIMKGFESDSIDCVITDPPFEVTDAEWDVIIPFEPMWTELERITKPKSAIVLFACQPFTSLLVASNLSQFRYEWIWKKEQGKNFQLAKIQPLKITESVLVFSKSSANYFPQGVIKLQKPIVKSNKRKSGTLNHVSSQKLRTHYLQEYVNYPTNFLEFDSTLDRGLHQNQKPVALLRYLIRTYTQPQATVLDFTAGSFSTGVTCAIENRNFIGIEQDAHYCAIGEARIKRALGQPCDIPQRITNEKELPLFGV